MSAKAKTRGFTVEVLPEDADSYGLFLRELAGDEQDGSRALSLKVKASRVRRVLDAVLEAVRASGHPKTAIGPERRSPLRLTEEAGVRLSLVLITTGPLIKSRRVESMVRGIAAMVAEEAYYWYAKCVGPDGARARRALRLLLAEE